VGVEEYIVTCILCPRGCRIKVRLEDGVVREVTGYQCPRGREYALREIREPVRTLITVVKCRGGDLPVVSVKTDKPIPRDRLLDASRALKSIVVEAPVNIGDVIVDGLLGLGVRVVATRPCRSRPTGR
jgi:CxxC motif-containing protein